MFDGVVVDVVDVSLVVDLIADGMFPIALLPDRSVPLFGAGS